MRKPICLVQAEYKSILEKACAECSETLLNHISLACDLNQEIHRALIAELRMGETK